MDGEYAPMPLHVMYSKFRLSKPKMGYERKVADNLKVTIPDFRYAEILLNMPKLCMSWEPRQALDDA
jgi:hypothetical protein